jgi:putative ABC transport system substrate-binding protein
MKRRDFLGLVGGAAAAWPLAVWAQQRSMPVLGFLGSQSPDDHADRLRALHQGLKDAGYVDGDNLAVLYRWAENQPGRLQALAADLVRRQVAAIIATGGPASVLTAKTTTATIPIVFVVSEDPVKLGLVNSLARPGGNVTGINFLQGELTAKRLELLRKLVPDARRIAVLINPAYATTTETTLSEVRPAARAMGLQVDIHKASTSDEIDAVFATFAHQRPDGLFVGIDPFFLARRVQVALLAVRSGVPASYGSREAVEAGGLMSYGTSLVHAWRQAGSYTARILKGEKPADLPVLQPTKFELVVNLAAAKTLGLAIPETFLALADEVIE